LGERGPGAGTVGLFLRFGNWSLFAGLKISQRPLGLGSELLVQFVGDVSRQRQDGGTGVLFAEGQAWPFGPWRFEGSAAGGSADAKASAVRVICVRK